MKKSIVVSLLLMFLLTGCISGLAVSEDVKDPAVKIEDIEIKDWADVSSEPGNEALGYAIVNNSKYTLTYFAVEEQKLICLQMKLCFPEKDQRINKHTDLTTWIK